MSEKFYQKILEVLPETKRNILLKDYTTYKIGGPAKYFFITKKSEDLISALKIAKQFKVPVFILGGGSNLLVADKGFKGLVIKIDINDISFTDNKVTAGAGVGLTKFSNSLSAKGLSGLEWAVGIPGTLGGAIYGHAQAFGTKISSSIESVEAVDIKNLLIKKFSKKQCQFSLKNSIFKKKKNFVIISATLKFDKKDVQEIKNKVEEFLNYRKTNHPINFPSAGSTFVNPEKQIRNKKLLETCPELKEYNKKGIIPAGYLIAKCGLNEKKMGNIQISKIHANFIVNLGGGKAKDVLKLMKLAQDEVKKII